ncbi:MAG: CDP-alcohol phosphatidyltransferase family protein [Polyangiaceae bacterium]|nr:CDP-alcohol phosphatidyltransferase family protein [Polyangiaceae bacterium]
MSARSLAKAESKARFDYASARLRGTVWQSVPVARWGYSALLLLGAILGRSGVSAQALTWGSLGFALLSGAAAASGRFPSAALLLLLSGALDVLDGVVARATGTSSRYGALLDSTVDRLADALPLTGLCLFYLGHGKAAVVPVMTMIAGFSVSYVRARAEGLGFNLPPLFMRRAERVVLLFVSLLLGKVALEHGPPAPLTLIGVGLLGAVSFVGLLVALRAARGAAE